MKRFTKPQLQQKAQGIFEKYPNEEVLFATTDGQFFIEKNRADLHAQGKKISVTEINKIDVLESKNSASKKPASKKPASKKPASKKPAAKKPATEKPATKELEIVSVDNPKDSTEQKQ